MTTFQQPISVRTNLFTNPSAEVDASGWGANLASVAQTTSDAFSGSASVEATYSGTAGDIWVSPTSNNFLPVVGGQPYSFSIYVKDVSTANTFQLGLDWYTGTSDYISTNNSSFFAVSTSGWTRISVSATAPALATQVGFRIRPNGTPATGTTARFDAALFEQSANVGDYFDGSTAGFTQANLATNPSFEASSGTVNVRTNLITNPSFEAGITGWAYNACTFVASTAQAFTGSNSGLVTATASTSGVGPYYQNISVTAGTTYTASIYVKDINTNTQYDASIWWFNGTTALVWNHGTPTTVNTSTWTRLSFTDTAPTGATNAWVIFQSSSGQTIGTQVYFDSALFEQSATLGDYFDGSTTASGDFTYAWSGTANASSSIQQAPKLVDWPGAGAMLPYRTTTTSYVGSSSAVLVNTSGASFQYAYNFPSGSRIAVTPGQTYTFTYYIKNINSTAQWFSTLSGFVAATGGGRTFYNDSGFVTPNTGTWQRSTNTWTIPAGVNYVEPWIINYTGETANGSVYVDAVVLERGSTAHDFYAGNYAPLTQTVNAWAATANVSISTQTVYVYTTQTTPTTYRYLFADLVTNQILAELPLTNVSFTTVLNGAGAFSGTMLVTDATQSYLNIWGATQPARTAVYVERFSSGGSPTLVWGGIVWARDYNSTTQHVTFNASEFESYFDKRKIIAVSGTTGSQVYKNADPVVIARTLIQNAETFAIGGSVLPQSNIGVSVGSETSSATISKTYYDAELKSVLAAIQDLSHASTSGFDFKIVVAYDSAFNPTKTFKIGYPRLGTTYSATNPTAPVMEFPGNVIEYTLLEDGTLASNFIYAVGVGNGQGKLNRYSYDAGQWSSGWPFLEAATNYGDVSNQTLLDNLALGQLNAVKNPPISLKIVYPPDRDPILGSYSLGDDVRIRINDDRAGQVDDYYRIVSISVTPGENNAGERATLTLTQKGAV